MYVLAMTPVAIDVYGPPDVSDRLTVNPVAPATADQLRATDPSRPVAAVRLAITDEVDIFLVYADDIVVAVDARQLQGFRQRLFEHHHIAVERAFGGILGEGF